ncbi:MAG: hypothetical protein NT120_01325 [Candidatus Aenigmarchaeota archaeon]|nr:hypothetical protein [Candidatus Aenigmarchaeota archaeon]
MIKAVIFDLNGVFIQSPLLSDRFSEKFNVSEKKFLPVLKEIMVKVRKPNAGDAFDLWKPHLNEWKVYLSREQFFDFWFSAEKEVSEMIALAKKLKAGKLRLFILSNNFAERAAYYKKKFRFLGELFEKVSYSWETGFVKPDRSAFENILSSRPESRRMHLRGQSGKQHCYSKICGHEDNIFYRCQRTGKEFEKISLI